MGSLKKTLNDKLAEYNEANATMDLVLFEDALCQVRPSVGPGELEAFDAWNAQYGSFQNKEAKAQALAS